MKDTPISWSFMKFFMIRYFTGSINPCTCSSMFNVTPSSCIGFNFSPVLLVLLVRIRDISFHPVTTRKGRETNTLLPSASVHPFTLPLLYPSLLYWHGGCQNGKKSSLCHCGRSQIAVCLLWVQFHPPITWSVHIQHLGILSLQHSSHALHQTDS